ncbi:MAG: class I SAM-dependent methyltransferase [Gemmatimonadetes bacterium]|nr:class I SAM-dependent methyltransferase [Gemmatimonadota bacterium]
MRSKPNEPSDPSAQLLARHTAVVPGDTVVHMHGSALLDIVSAHASTASRVLVTHRNIATVRGLRRALNESGVTNVEVFAGHGTDPLPRDVSADVATIRIPRETLPLRQLLKNAFDVLRIGGHCFIAGANDEGARSAARSLHQLFGNAEVLARGSGHRVIAASKDAATPTNPAGLDSPYLDGDNFCAYDVTLRTHAFTVYSRPGVFSWDHLDEATATLANVMQVNAGDSVLDLGCGAGVLGTLAALLSQTGRVVMVDADTEAIRSATSTAEAAGAHGVTVLASDVADAVIDQRFDVVVTNPPFHTGKATDLDLPGHFIRDAWTVLEPGGRLYLVANRTLPYERAIRKRFGNISVAHDGPRFKVLAAIR